MADLREQGVLKWLPIVILMAVAGSSCDDGERVRIAEENAGLARKVTELTASETLYREEVKLSVEAMKKEQAARAEERGLLSSLASNQQARIEAMSTDLEEARNGSAAMRKRFDALSAEHKALLKQLGDAPGWDSIQLRSGKTMVGRVHWIGEERIALQLPDGLMVTGAVGSVSTVRVRVPGLTPDARPSAPVSPPVPAPVSPATPAPVSRAVPAPVSSAASVPVSPAVPVPSAVNKTAAPPSLKPAPPPPGPAQLPPAAGADPAPGDAAGPPPPPQINLQVIRHRNQKIGEAGKTALLQIQAPELAITVSNLSRQDGVTGLKARIWIVARGVQDTGEFQLLYAREEAFALEPGAEWSFRTEPRKITARQADKFANRSGWELYGYLVRIEHGDALLSVKASVNRLEKSLEVLEGKKEGAVFRM